MQLEHNIGHDGWIFFGNSHQYEFDQAIGRKVLEYQDIATYRQAIELISNFCRSRGSTFLFSIAPSKTNIYIDKILHPSDPSTVSPETNCTLIYKNVDEMHIVDLREALIESRAKADTYSRLNSHWTDYGGWIAWVTMSKEISKHRPDFYPNTGLELASIGEANQFNEMKDVFGIDGINNWTYPIFKTSLPSIQMVTATGQIYEQLGTKKIDLTEFPVDILNASAKNDLRCLVLSDSMISSVSPYINYNFKKTSYRNHHYNYHNLPCNIYDLLCDDKYDIVIYMMAERYLLFPIDASYLSHINYLRGAKKENLYSWPLAHEGRYIASSSGNNISAPNLFILPSPGNHGSLIVHFRICGSEFGDVMTSYMINGNASQKWHRTRPGLNNILIRIDAQVDQNHIWITSKDGGPAIVLLDVVVAVI